MDFAEVLKDILKCSNVKVYNLASSLGYDASYVSKWLSGARRPTEGMIGETADKIAGFCVRSASPRNLAAVCEKYGLSKSSPESTEKELAEIIIRAYNGQGVHNSAVKSKEGTRNFGKELMRNADFIHALQEYVPGEEQLECIISAEMHQTLIHALESAGKDVKKIRAHYRVLINTGKFENNVTDYCRYVSTFLNAGSGSTVELYEIDPLELENSEEICIIRNHTMLAQLIDPFASCPRMVVITNKNTVNDSYDATLAIISKLSHSETIPSGSPNYDKYFYKHMMSSCHRELYKQMFLCYVDDDMLEMLSRSHDLSRYTDQLLYSYRIIWSKGESIIIYESTLLDYIRNGRLRVTTDDDYVIILSPEERKQHLRLLIDAFRKSPEQHTFRIFKDRNPFLNYDDADITMFITPDDVVLSSVTTTNMSYLFSSESIEMFNRFYTLIENDPGDYLMTMEQSLDFLEKGLSVL